MIAAATGKTTAIRLFNNSPVPRLAAENESPNARMRFVLVEGSQERPHRQSGRERQHDIGNQDSCEQEESDTCGHA